MTKKFSFISLAFLLVSNCLSQDLKPSKYLIPNKYLHDFGVVKQESGEVYYTFDLKNTSNRTVVISTVQPECSCTEPTWTEEEIKSGGTAKINVGYKADHYPGEFDKKITVYTTADTFELKIIGKVTPKPLSDIEKEYPINIGALRLKDDVFGLNTIYDNTPKTKEFMIYNDSTKAINNLKFENLPKYLSISIPASIPPKTQSKITVVFDPKIYNDYGHSIDYLPLKVGANSKEIPVMANISPYIPNYSQAELAKAPRLKTDSLDIINLGVLSANSKYARKITIANSGFSELKILSIKPACPCITSDFKEKFTLKPNESKVITLVFDTQGRSGNTKKSVYIYSTDPSNPAHVFKMSADIR